MQELELTCGAVGSLGAVGWVCARNTDLPRSTLSSLLSLPPHLSFHKPSVAPCSEVGSHFTPLSTLNSPVLSPVGVAAWNGDHWWSGARLRPGLPLTTVSVTSHDVRLVT